MKNINSSPIAVFDTGMGGLALVKEINVKYPNQNVYFFTDNARFPYGANSRKTATKWLLEIADFLKQRGVSQMFLGCNTVTAMTDGLLPEDNEISIRGPISDTVNAVKNNLRNVTLVIFATNTTIRSGLYQSGLQGYNGEVIALGGNGLETVVEREGVHGSQTKEKIEGSIDQIKEEIEKRKMQIDELAIVLGCTHYVLAERTIKDVLGEQSLNWRIFNPLPYIVQTMLQDRCSDSEVTNGKGELTVLHTAPFNDVWWNRCLEFTPQDMPTKSERVLLI